MYSPYRGRGHTKKQKHNYKPAITPAERKRRKQQKQIIKDFPTWKCLLPCFVPSRGGGRRSGEVHSPLTFDQSHP